jgi:alcohol dehydrogenase
MTAGMSPALTASTGMDALTHAIEAAVSILRNPFSTALALGAIRIIRRRLPECVRNGSDLKARAEMQIAATMAGMAFSSAQVGLTHAVSHSLGAICGVPHGIANGIMLPTVMRFNAPSCVSEMAEVALALGVEYRGQSGAELAEEAAHEVENLLIEINHPRRLAEMGVKSEQVSACVALALSDAAIISNPRKPITPEDVEKIIIAVF